MKQLIVSLALVLPLAAHAGFDEAVQAYGTGDYAGALAEFKVLADQGKPEAQYFMGLFYHLRHPLLALEAARAICRETLIFQTITTLTPERERASRGPAARNAGTPVRLADIASLHRPRHPAPRRRRRRPR